MALFGASLTGDKALDRKLAALGPKTSTKAVTAGVNAGLRAVGKAMRSAVNAADASPNLKREARKTIGSKFSKAKRGEVKGRKVAKVGFGVGRTKAKIARSQTARGKRMRAGKTKGRGVGVSAQNIHWFVLGTKERTSKSGKAFGKIDDAFIDVTDMAIASSKQASLAAAKKKIGQVILNEARKRR